MFTVFIFKRKHLKLTQSSSHLSSIGYSSISTREDFDKICDTIISKGKKYDIPGNEMGFYYNLANPEGPELWLGTDVNGNYKTFVPHFSGKNANKVKIAEAFTHPDWQFDGVFKAHFDSINGEDDNIPIIFETPHHLIYLAESFPKEANLYLTAFAEEIEFFNNSSDYYQKQQGSIKFARESFLPIGQFCFSSGESIIPESTAYINGVIDNSEILKNSRTGEHFYSLDVKLLGLTINLVADITLIDNNPPPGTIVSSTVWLVGRFE